MTNLKIGDFVRFHGVSPLYGVHGVSPLYGEITEIWNKYDCVHVVWFHNRSGNDVVLTSQKTINLLEKISLAEAVIARIKLNK